MHGRGLLFSAVVCAGLASLAPTCGDDAATDGDGGSGGVVDPTIPTMTPIDVVVSSEGGPAGITTNTSNNNLDVVKFQDRTFLAWRSAPSHFASPDTVMHVASEGPDGWREEGAFALGTDVREPRFLVIGDRLFLYFAVLGVDPFKFEPQGMKVTEYHGANTWDAPEDLYEPGFIPWRAKVLNGTPYLIGYVGGENIYETNGEPIQIHFLKTTDGRTLEPVVAGKPVVEEGGGSETDFEFLDDGSLVAVTRDEAGDAEYGWGSKVCTAPANDLGTWTCTPDKKKYDSPLVFRHGQDVWLVGRRNVSDTGNYDLEQRDLSPKDQAEAYEVDYSFKPKRCSLWKVDPATRSVAFVVDLPSRGDTCFASRIDQSADVTSIYNYSSDLDGASDCKHWPDDCADITWWVGQGSPTMIYRTNLTFPTL